jgi:hypothetical protein
MVKLYRVRFGRGRHNIRVWIVRGKRAVYQKIPEGYTMTKDNQWSSGKEWIRVHVVKETR